MISLAGLWYYAASAIGLLTRFTRPLTMAMWFVPGLRPRRDIVEVRRPRLRFRVRGRMDIWSVKETVVDRCYERYGFAVRPNWIVVDIGAAIGDFAILAASVPGTRVLAFEPLPASLALLKENAAQNGATNVTAFDLAVSDSAGTLRLDTSGDPLSMGTSSDAACGIEVAAITLAGVLDIVGDHRIDLLKIDCEGAEYEILMGAPAATLQRIDRIVLEYHDHRPGRRHTDLMSHLQNAGFAVGAVPNVVHPALLGYMRAQRRASR